MALSRRRRRLVVSLAAELGVLAAFPFIASGVAHAALAGGNPLTTTNRPDLRTVHVSVPLDQATFCFDKELSNQGFGGGPIPPGFFWLAGYRYDTGITMSTSNLSSSNQSCIVGTVLPKFIYGGTRDLSSYLDRRGDPAGRDRERRRQRRSGQHRGLDRQPRFGQP